MIFHWMFEDERWRYKFLFQALILLIPVVGLIALLGWSMGTYDNLVAGGQDLAPTGFPLRRGLRLFLIGLVYWIGLGLPKTGLRYLDAVLGGGTLFGPLADLYNDVALLLFALVIVPVFVATDRRGLLGGIDVVHVAGSMLAKPLQTAVAALVVLIASVIGILGFAVIVAAPFTITYAAAVVASVAAWWSGPQRIEAAVVQVEVPHELGPPPPPWRPPGMGPAEPSAE